MSLTKKHIVIAISLLFLTLIELSIFGRADLRIARNALLLGLMAVKALMVVLVYMNLKNEPLAIKIAFFILIPVGVYFLLFMMYDAAYLWHS
ncbi:MAG: hypothetical protein KBD53_06490 [Candidatus Omnitrophica bacterium]|nr:hypothetical protein [Candidatus Omnitrophota bacterium]